MRLTWTGSTMIFVAVILATPICCEGGDTHDMLRRYCTDCHGSPDEFPEGGVSLTLEFEKQPLPKSGPILKKVLDAVEGFEMPRSTVISQRPRNGSD